MKLLTFYNTDNFSYTQSSQYHSLPSCNADLVDRGLRLMSRVTEVVIAVSSIAWFATLHTRLACSSSLEARSITEAVTSVSLLPLVTITAASVTSLCSPRYQ